MTSTPVSLGKLDTTSPPAEGDARPVALAKGPLLLTQHHHLCAGCGHPISHRLLLEVVDELGLADNFIGTIGHGCYTMMSAQSELDFVQVLHGRSPAVATGVKRMHPGVCVVSIQGDGDMASEGLHEILHAAARGENITCIMLNNGVFGDTGGQMTGATVVGQRTKTSLEGRDPVKHGYPVPVANLVAGLPGSTYVARGGVHNAGSIAKTKRMLRTALETQMHHGGLTFVEILTMCPTGWFKQTPEGPEYLAETIEETFPIQVLKAPGSE